MVRFALTPGHAEYPDSLVLQQKYSTFFDIRRELGDDDALVLSEMLRGVHGDCETETLVLTTGTSMSIRGAQALSTGITQSSKLQGIVFHGATMMDRDVKRTLLQGIATSTTVQKLLEYSPTDAASLGYICQSLHLNKNIADFTFRITPSLTVRGARLFSRRIGGSNLESLSISHGYNTLRDVAVTRLLCKGIQKIQTLKTLEFECFIFDWLDIDVLPQIMRSLPSLQHLKIKGYGPYPRSLYESLRVATSLRTLELNIGGLSEADMRNLSNGLRNSSVTKLSLASTYVDDACVRAFVELWPQDSSINHLDFSNNYIGPEGALLLLRAANEHPALESLHISNNQIGYSGLASIGELLPTLRIKKLCVSFSPAEMIHHGDQADALAEPIEAAKNRASRSLVQGMKLNVQTQLLGMYGVFSEEVESEINFYSHLNVSGRYLLSMHPGLPLSVWCNILAKYNTPLDRSLIYGFLLEQPRLMQERQCSAIEKLKQGNRAGFAAFTAKMKIALLALLAAAVAVAVSCLTKAGGFS